MHDRPGLFEGMARLMLSGIFLYRSIVLLVRPTPFMESMLAKGIPFVPAVFTLALTLLILGGLALALGYRTKTAATVLLVLTLAVTFVFYPPWQLEWLQMFFLHLSICGGLLNVMIYGPGLWSFDGRDLVPVRRRRT